MNNSSTVYMYNDNNATMTSSRQDPDRGRRWSASLPPRKLTTDRNHSIISSPLTPEKRFIKLLAKILFP